MSTSESKKNSIDAEDNSVKQVKNRRRSVSITIRATENEKAIITSCAQKRGRSISAYLIESAIHSDSSICTAFLPVVKELRKFTNMIRITDQSLCEANRRTPTLDDVVEMQKKICDMVQSIAINI